MIEQNFSKEKLFKIKLLFCAIYGLLITVLSKSLLYALSLDEVKNFITLAIQIFSIDIMFFDFLAFSEPFLHLERLEFLLEWWWILPYGFFAFVMGCLHPRIFSRRLDFSYIVYTSVFAYIFMLLTYSIPFGVWPVLFYFAGFVAEFYREPLFIIPTTLVFVFLGTEVTEIWLMNNRKRRDY